jgi:nucleoid DNA-binding protein
MIMTKIDIMESVYEELGTPKKDCVRLVDSFFDTI